MAYSVFSHFNKDVLDHVATAFEHDQVDRFCPLGLLLEEVGLDVGFRPLAARVRKALVAYGVDSPGSSAGRFIHAWDCGWVTPANLRQAMGLKK